MHGPLCLWQSGVSGPHPTAPLFVPCPRPAATLQWNKVRRSVPNLARWCVGQPCSACGLSAGQPSPPTCLRCVPGSRRRGCSMSLLPYAFSNGLLRRPASSTNSWLGAASAAAASGGRAPGRMASWERAARVSGAASAAGLTMSASSRRLRRCWSSGGPRRRALQLPARRHGQRGAPST